MNANITIQSEVTEISIEHDVYSDLTVSVEQHKFNDQIKVTINNLAINVRSLALLLVNQLIIKVLS